MSKKKFKETTVGKLLLGAASVINPTLSNVLQGVTTPQEAIAEITKSDAPKEDKIKLQQLIYDQQNKEIEAITSRWKADSMSDSWLSKNVRPLVLVWCIFENLCSVRSDLRWIFGRLICLDFWSIDLSGFLVDLWWMLMHILNMFARKNPGMSVT